MIICGQIWIQLEEKQIPYTVEKINLGCYGEKSESFLEKAPSGLVPVIELDGKVRLVCTAFFRVQ